MLERKLCFKALVGSHNYNLNTAQSDRDYKIFFFPNFDDLYLSGQYSKAIIGEDEDVEYHDIRKLPSLLYKSNVNFIEVLFSEEYEVYDSELFEKLILMREEIARMNLPHLYDACFGMYRKKISEYARDKEREIVEKTLKHAMSAYRILDFLKRFKGNQFSSFKQAIQYDFTESNRDLLLGIRNMKYNFKQLEEMLDEMENQVSQLEKIYKRFEVDIILKEKIELMIKDRIKSTLRESL